jgi:hypothetical protein
MRMVYIAFFIYYILEIVHVFEDKVEENKP